MKAVELHHIGKHYGKEKIPALNDIDFNIAKGELFGIIGPDGAGKTSIFRILTTVLLPDSGEAKVDGFDVVKDYKEIRKRVGYMPGKFSLYPDLTVEENLNFFATVFNADVEENMDLIHDIYVQIQPFKDRRAGKLSGGMKQKLALCCALIHKPSVLFLDEPTTGVDPVSRREFWEMLKRLKAQNITIVVSTPYMDEAVLCDRVALMQNGNILAIDSPENIISSYPNILYAIKSSKMSTMLNLLSSIPSVVSCNSFGEFAHISFVNNIDKREEIIHFLQEKGLKDIEIIGTKAGIEDCFIHFLKQ